MAARYRRAARVGGIHVRISRRSDNARICLSAFIAGKQTHFSRAVGADAEGSCYAAFLPRCMADSSAPGGPRLAARVARCVAFHLSRGPGASAGENAFEAGLSISHVVGCDWTRARQRIAG